MKKNSLFITMFIASALTTMVAMLAQNQMLFVASSLACFILVGITCVIGNRA